MKSEIRTETSWMDQSATEAKTHFRRTQSFSIHLLENFCEEKVGCRFHQIRVQIFFFFSTNFIYEIFPMRDVSCKHYTESKDLTHKKCSTQMNYCVSTKKSTDISEESPRLDVPRSQAFMYCHSACFMPLFHYDRIFSSHQKRQLQYFEVRNRLYIRYRGKYIL